MKTEKQLDKGISDIVGVFTDPILVFPGGWGDSLPDWLKGAITVERLMMNIGVLKGEAMTGTDAEACTYLMTVSLTQPMDSDWTQIYLYVAGKTYSRHKQGGLPEDIRVESLRDDQMQRPRPAESMALSAANNNKAGAGPRRAAGAQRGSRG